jgi:hypothetical protein
MIVARTLASAARSCIQRCRQSRGAGRVRMNHCWFILDTFSSSLC